MSRCVILALRSCLSASCSRALARRAAALRNITSCTCSLVRRSRAHRNSMTLNKTSNCPRKVEVKVPRSIETSSQSDMAVASALRGQPDVLFKVIEFLCARLRRTSEQVQDVMFLNAPARLAKALLQLADKQER